MTPFRIFLGGLALILSGCASGPEPIGFSKVKYFHLKEEDRRLESMSIDPMIRFERQHYLHGAVTEAQEHDRLGHYYTLFWRGNPGAGPVTVRFEYRQALSGERVFRFDQVIARVREKNETALAVIGEPYHRYGRVVAWQATLLQNGKVIDQERSFLWK